MVRVLFALAAVALGGCAAAPITPAGGQVRQIQPEGATPCKFIGVVEVQGGFFYSSLTEARRDMLAKLRNETALVKGNAYTVTAIVAERGISLPFAQGDAYLCP